jgi:LysM repeat protein
LISLIGLIVLANTVSNAQSHVQAGIAAWATTNATSPATFAATQATTPAATLAATSVAVPVPRVADELFIQINKLRASLGLAPYIRNDALSAAALDQAHWMASVGVVTHIRPDNNRPAHRALAAGYPESYSVSEIIYMSRIATLDHAWEFWLNSKIHYAELTNPRHRDAGAGVARSQAFGLALVVVFGGYIIPPPVAAPPAVPGTHVVESGDTLYRLAQRYGVSVAALAAVNNIGGNSILHIGQVLVIPQPTAPLPTPVPLATPTLVPSPAFTPTALPALSPSPTSSLPAPRQHVVQRGETLFQIARRYGVPLDKLIAANGITNPDRIEVGQVLIIPD